MNISVKSSCAAIVMTIIIIIPSFVRSSSGVETGSSAVAFYTATTCVLFGGSLYVAHKLGQYRGWAVLSYSSGSGTTE